MSAIAGVYLLDGSSVDQIDLKRMNNSLSHRGPDGSGLWCEGPVGLTHQMLWTTPESLNEKLPLDVDSLVITSDSRIDNRDELLPALGLSEEVSDSYVIQKAYSKWGQNCLDKLLGDFAFVICDKAKGELFCARDHMGMRPFYYYHKPGEIFAFATEIKALFAWGVPRTINEVAIGDYLLALAEDKEITFYKDIKRLPSAHCLIVKLNESRKEQYWTLDPTQEIRFGSDEEYEKAFRDIFTEAVRCRLRSAYPVGSMLSGGLDSSSIVCVAREILPEDRHLRTFSIIFDTVKECDERPYMNAVLAGDKLDAHFVYGDKMGPLTDMERILWHEDQPLLVPNFFLIWASFKEANNQNVRVLLNGLDGDVIVSHGIAYITELTAKLRLISMIRELRGLSKNCGDSQGCILLKYSLYPFVPASLVRLKRKLCRAEFKIKIVNQEFARRINLIDRRNELLRGRSGPAKTAREDHWRNINLGIYQILNEIENIAGAAFSIEPRSPFFDKRLVEFCLALPGDQKIRHGWVRWIMRSALRDVLPEEIYHRGGKTVFSSNFLHCLLAFDKAILKNLISTNRSILSKYVDTLELSESYRRLVSPEKQLKDDGLYLFLVENLLLWLRSFDL